MPAMMHTATRTAAPSLLPVAPWSLRAWPPLLWQAGHAPPVHFQHLGTRITFSGDPVQPPTGQTVWAAHAEDGEAGMAWDWVEVAHGVVAMSDPMSVVTNLRLLGHAGQVLTAQESALFLNEVVRSLPWQHEVSRALHGRPN